MMHAEAEYPLRDELRDLLETSVQPLNLYGALLRRFGHLSRDEMTLGMADPVTAGLRSSLQDLLPGLRGPYLDLPARAALCHLLTQTTREEEMSLGLALFEHVALQLEPYLRAAELDPDQARYLRPLLGAQRLELRPVENLVAARRAERQMQRTTEVQPAVATRRVADNG